MALIKCSECGKEISDKAEICVNCGNPIQKEKKEIKEKNKKQYQQLTRNEKANIIKLMKTRGDYFDGLSITFTLLYSTGMVGLVITPFMEYDWWLIVCVCFALFWGLACGIYLSNKVIKYYTKIDYDLIKDTTDNTFKKNDYVLKNNNEFKKTKIKLSSKNKKTIKKILISLIVIVIFIALFIIALISMNNYYNSNYWNINIAENICKVKKTLNNSNSLKINNIKLGTYEEYFNEYNILTESVPIYFEIELKNDSNTIEQYIIKYFDEVNYLIEPKSTNIETNNNIINEYKKISNNVDRKKIDEHIKNVNENNCKYSTIWYDFTSWFF